VAQRIPVSLAIPQGNPRALMIEPSTPLADGSYRLIVTPAPDTGLSSIGGERLGGAPATGGAVVVTEFELAVQP
jgi:hypothetical protein